MPLLITTYSPEVTSSTQSHCILQRLVGASWECEFLGFRFEVIGVEGVGLASWV